MSSINHARTFLTSVDPDYSMRCIGKQIFEAAEKDKSISALLDEIQEKMGSGRSIIDSKTSDIFERLKCARAIPDIPSAPEWARPLIALGYLKARSSLATKDTSVIHSDLKKSLKVVSKLIDGLETDFLGDLLVETMIAAREDAGFSRKLSKGGQRFMNLAKAVYGETPPPVGPETDENTAQRAAAPGAGGGRGACSACRTVGGMRRCTPISCWVIVVIIIIIIVTK